MISTENISFKELTNCYFKANYPMQIGSTQIETGEIIASFDKIQISGLEEFFNRTTANGGFNNSPRVFWEEPREVKFQFTQGIFSKEQFSLMSNSKLMTIAANTSIEITKVEELESNTSGVFELSYTPIQLFLYNKSTGAKITSYTRSGKQITIATPFLDVVAHYTYSYVGGAQMVEIGNQLFNGYISLEAKTRVKDDTNGQVTTGLLKIPKLKLMSNLSMRLGTQANPIVGSFSAVGVPVGSRGDTHICEFLFLNNDIDSDI